MNESDKYLYENFYNNLDNEYKKFVIQQYQISKQSINYEELFKSYDVSIEIIEEIKKDLIEDIELTRRYKILNTPNINNIEVSSYEYNLMKELEKLINDEITTTMYLFCIDKLVENHIRTHYCLKEFNQYVTLQYQRFLEKCLVKYIEMFMKIKYPLYLNDLNGIKHRESLKDITSASDIIWKIIYEKINNFKGLSDEYSFIYDNDWYSYIDGPCVCARELQEYKGPKTIGFRYDNFLEQINKILFDKNIKQITILDLVNFLNKYKSYIVSKSRGIYRTRQFYNDDIFNRWDSYTNEQKHGYWFYVNLEDLLKIYNLEKLNN